MITFDMKPGGRRQGDGATGRLGEGEKGKSGDKEIRR
jgi:hypothetical protein